MSAPGRGTAPIEALGLNRASELISIVGGGGKSSLMFALAHNLPGRVVATTTTRIFAAQMNLTADVCSVEDDNWRERLEAFESNLLVVGGVEGERAVGVAPELADQLFAHPAIDWVVVEADGSRMLPVKAPAEHEPVVPKQTTLLVVVAGIDALGGPLCEVAHRPERVSSITGVGIDDSLTPEALAVLLTSPRGGLKHAPESARVAVLLNKVESPPQRQLARETARCILREQPRVERVVLGALRRASDWEVLRRE